MSKIIIILVLQIALASCVRIDGISREKLSFSGEYIKIASEIGGLNGECPFDKPFQKESPYEYAVRYMASDHYKVSGFDYDCVIGWYSKNELHKYSVKLDYTAIGAVNILNISENSQPYCGGYVQLFGYQGIRYHDLVKYRDFVPEYYLFLARVNNKICKKYDIAYDYYIAAESTGAVVQYYEKSIRF